MRVTEIPSYTSPRFGECRDVTSHLNAQTKALDLEGLTDVTQTPEVVRFIKGKMMGVPIGMAVYQGDGAYWLLAHDGGGPFDEKPRFVLVRKERLVWSPTGS